MKSKIMMPGRRTGARLILLLSLAFTAFDLTADAQCMMCHVAQQSSSAHPITSSAKNKDSSVAKIPGCTNCHGASLTHPGNPTANSPDTPFNATQTESALDWNGQCLACHQEATRHWQASEHALEDISCNACHRVHNTADVNTVSDRQINTCGSCHQNVRKDFLLPSHHPVNEAEMTCSDCHNPHGTLTPGQLTGVTSNATCLGCHEAQRGPFLFDHPPASEDCMSCHKPHGAIHKPLLTARGPQLCQQCHMANFHPSNLEAGGGLPGRRPSASLLGRNCMNCHPKVHGTNHPSGARLTR